MLTSVNHPIASEAGRRNVSGANGVTGRDCPLTVYAYAHLFPAATATATATCGSGARKKMPNIAEATRGKFPGMRPSEANLMRRWLARHEQEYDSFAYNVRIGAGRDPGPQYPDWVRKSAVMCSMLRMDAIAWKGNQATIIELKNVAYPSAAQQLALYGAVWWSDNATYPKPKLLLVCRGIDLATWATAAPAGITVEVLGFA